MAGRHAAAHDTFENLAQDIAVAEPAVTIDRERRVIGHLVLEPEPAEPSVGKVHLDLPAQPTLRTDRIAIADQEHPDQQLRVDRRATGVAVVRCKLGTKPAQVENRVDPTQQVIARNPIIQTELVKQTILPSQPLTHHDPNLQPIASGSGNHDRKPISTEFFNKLSHKKTLEHSPTLRR
jgi:hypothetical protein